MEKVKEMKCYKRLIYKQVFQVSGLLGPQFPSHLPKRFTHLCRALYGDAIKAAGNQQKHLEFRDQLYVSVLQRCPSYRGVR